MAEAESVAESVFVARQPIFDEKQDVFGYELLFRASGEAREAAVTDDNMATAKVIADGFVLASGGMAEGQRALVNFPQQLILDNFAFALPADIAIIEILEDVRPTPEVLEAIGGFKEAGYLIAMDDFMGEPELEPFLEHVAIIKVDILGILGPEGAAHADKLKAVTEKLYKYDCKLLAEKVEDNDVFKLCKELGYTLFQGYFFSKPEIIPGKKISSNEISKVQLLKELGNPDFEVDRLSKIISLDASLSYRLFRYINSAGMGVAQKVESVSRAITLLGHRQLSQWLRVVIMSDLSPTKKSEEVTFLCVHRGRFLEQLALAANACKEPPEKMFLLGLFSLLDALLGQPMDEVLELVPLEADVEAALKGQDSPLGVWIKLTEAFERGNFGQAADMLESLGLSLKEADRHYVEAMNWTQGILGDDGDE